MFGFCKAKTQRIEMPISMPFVLQMMTTSQGAVALAGMCIMIRPYNEGQGYPVAVPIWKQDRLIWNHHWANPRCFEILDENNGADVLRALKVFVPPDKQPVFLPSGLAMPCYLNDENTVVLPAVDQQRRIFPVEINGLKTIPLTREETTKAVDSLITALDVVHKEKAIVITTSA